MTVTRELAALERKPRAVAIGTFDGVHRGHQAVVGAASASGLVPTVVTLDPHPRVVLGNRVELVTTLERRLELLLEAGAEDIVVVEFKPELMRLEPEEFAREVPRDDRGGGRRGGRGLPLRVSPTRRSRAPRASRLRRAGGAGGRGRLVDRDSRRPHGGRHGRCGDHARPPVRARRHGRRRRPTRGDARVPDREPRARCAARLPPARHLRGRGARPPGAVSIGTNPHYGGTERRIEPHLLDFEGDLYGRRLVVELWERLRDEAVFASEDEPGRADRPGRRAGSVAVRPSETSRPRRRRTPAEAFRVVAPVDGDMEPGLLEERQPDVLGEQALEVMVVHRTEGGRLGSRSEHRVVHLVRRVLRIGVVRPLR